MRRQAVFGAPPWASSAYPYSPYLGRLEAAEKREKKNSWGPVEDLQHQSFRKLGLTASLVVLSLSVTACGSSEGNQVEETVKAFYRAAAEGDGEGACEQLTPAARAPAGGVSCEHAIDQLGDLGGKAAKRRLAAVEVRNVKVRGKQAMVEAVIPTQTPTPLRLRKVERSALPALAPLSEWKLDSLGTGPGMVSRNPAREVAFSVNVPYGAVCACERSAPQAAA